MAVHDLTNLRLEVQDNPTGLVNLIANPIPALGAWGYVTRRPNNVMNRVLPAGEDPDLQHLLTAAGDASWESEVGPAAPGQFAAAYLRVVQQSAAYTLCVEWVDANGAVIGGGIATGKPTVVGNNTIPATGTGSPGVAPVGTAGVRLACYRPASGVQTTMRLTRATLACAATSGALAGLGYIAHPGFINVLASVGEIIIERDELSVSTLTATFESTALDPAVNNLLRPGKAVRLVVLRDGLWTPIYTGRIDSVPTVYPLTNPDATRRARITLAAVDAATALANVSRPQGVATIDELPFVLEGAGVPWNVNGSVNQIATDDVSVVSRNADAKALDQVAITRDSRRGYAWVTNRGVLNVVDAAELQTFVAHTFTEADYGDDLDVSFDLDTVVNEVNVTLLRTNLATGETVEVPFGPYRDTKSVREWGIRSSTFVVHGIAESAVPGYAAAVLSANATPRVRINSATIAVGATDDTLDLRERPLIDLYQFHRLRNAAKGIDQTSYVTRISQRIRSDSWTIGLGYRATGSVAAPQTTPPVQSAPFTPTGVWQLATVAGPYTAVGGAEPRYMRDDAGNVHLQGRVNRNAASDGATVLTLPADLRPSISLHHFIHAEPRGTASGVMFINSATGAVGLFATRGAPASYSISIAFPTL